MAGKGTNVGAVTVHADDFQEFALQLMAASASIQSEFAVQMRGVGQVIADRATQMIAPYSSTIPSTIGVEVTDQLKVDVTASAPLSGLFELGNAGSGRTDLFKHPVFGNKAVWVTQAMHPFLGPAVKESEGEADEASQKALDAVLEALAHG